MKHLFKFIVALGVFTMTIGSSFAMDNNPPTEPVKAIVETEVVEEAPMQSLFLGFVAYKDALGNCIAVPNPMHCTLSTGQPRCTVKIGENDYDLFAHIYDQENDTWSCDLPLYEIPKPF